MTKPSPREANEIDAYVGARIRQRRQVMKMSQENLGESLGITFQQVQKYERGTNRVSAGRLMQIADILSVPIRYFYDGCDGSSTEEAAPSEPIPSTFELNDPDLAELSMAFAKIKTPVVRRKLLQLVRSITED